jgi:hypothetical protein
MIGLIGWNGDLDAEEMAPGVVEVELVAKHRRLKV